MWSVKKIKLGDLLLEQGMITAEQLTAALEVQAKTQLRLGQVLLNQGVVTEDTLLTFLAKQLDIPFYDLRQHHAVPQVAKTLTEGYARRYRAIVLNESAHHYLVGIADPLDLNATDEIQRVLPRPVKFALVRESDLLRTLDLVYRRTEEISAFAEALDEAFDDSDQQAQQVTELEVQAGEADAPVIQLLRSVFEDAVQVGASDIHIEPDHSLLRIRLRVDGILQEQLVKEFTIARAIITRLKLMANLNIAEHRLPQDGRFHTRVRGHIIDVRLSTMPTQYGESAVMRLLDQSTGLLQLDRVMSGQMLTAFKNVLTHPHGVILVTGPTGSGKTTTLNGALQFLNTPEAKIITVEDPVEYQIERVTQVHVNYKVGLDFAKVLRSALRQDPDIILVGEMRDQETASVAIRAALTGHLVLSTLHTNDAASSAIRLMDMGVEGFLLASTLRGILAQRLVRKICMGCKVEYQPEDQERSWLEVCGKDPRVAKFWHGAGCATCNHSGYRGRIGVFELLEMTYPMLEALRMDKADEFLRLARVELKGKLLVDYALASAEQGLTTISEVMQIYTYEK